MGCTQSYVVEHNAMYCQYNVVFDDQSATYDSVLTYQVGEERKEKAEKKNNMHGGLNQMLKKNGYEPEGNCSGAIAKAYNNGLIDETTKDYCSQVNQHGNDGTHNWGQKGKKKPKAIEGSPTVLFPVFTYQVGPERKAKTDKKHNAHGGLNQLLTKHGLEPEGNFYVAIQVAYQNGLINKGQKSRYEKINLQGNDGNHEW